MQKIEQRIEKLEARQDGDRLFDEVLARIIRPDGACVGEVRKNLITGEESRTTLSPGEEKHHAKD